MPTAGADLGALVGVIETLQERITRDHATIGSNEARTRKELIDPLLTALGWADSSVVTLEYLVRYGWGENDYRVADYALHEPGRRAQPFAFVEAKRMREDLTDEHREQAFTYADIRENATHVVLTNGDRWEFYEAREDHFRCALDISIRDESAIDCAERLLGFGRGTDGFAGAGWRDAGVPSSLRDRDGIATAKRQSITQRLGGVDWRRALAWSGLSAFLFLFTGYVTGFRAADPFFDSAFGVVGTAVAVVLFGLGTILLVLRLPWRRLPWHWLWPIVGDLRNTLVGLSGGVVVAGAIGAGLGYAAGLRTAQFVYDVLTLIGILVVVACLALFLWVMVAGSRGKRRR